MPHKSRALETAAEWLRRAEGNMVRAKQPKPANAFWEDYCFDAQQAADKALKGLCIARGIRFPFSHDLAELLAALDRGGVVIPDGMTDVAFLSDYATQTRYPGWGAPVTEQEYLEAVKAAQQVMTWAKKLFTSFQ